MSDKIRILKLEPKTFWVEFPGEPLDCLKHFLIFESRLHWIIGRLWNIIAIILPSWPIELQDFVISNVLKTIKRRIGSFKDDWSLIINRFCFNSKTFLKIPKILSSRSQMFCKIGVFKNFANFTKKHMLESLLIKLPAWSSATLFNKRLQNRFYGNRKVSFCNIIKSTFCGIKILTFCDIKKNIFCDIKIIIFCDISKFSFCDIKKVVSCDIKMFGIRWMVCKSINLTRSFLYVRQEK